MTILVKVRSPGSGTPTGTVTISDGGVVLAVVSLSAGSSTIVLANLLVGMHLITVAYGGPASMVGSSAQRKIIVRA